MKSVKKIDGPAVEVSQLSKHFDTSRPWLNRLLEGKPKQVMRAVDGVSFSIERGKTLALVGESGCGKSTVARLLVGLYQATDGEIRVLGQDVGTMKTKAGKPLRQKIQMIFQDPYASLNPRWRIKRIIAEPLVEHKLIRNKKDIEQRVAELIVIVGLSVADLNKFPHQFSGGQRQRISIARALATQPEFLVCDEPTSALDVSVQAQVLNLMKELQSKQGLTYLFISHNLAVVSYVADEVAVMYMGRIVEMGDKSTIFSAPLHPYTEMLLEAIPDLEMTGKERSVTTGEVSSTSNPVAGCAFQPRCRYAVERCKAERPEARRIGSATVACHLAEPGWLAERAQSFMVKEPERA